MPSIQTLDLGHTTLATWELHTTRGSGVRVVTSDSVDTTGFTSVSVGLVKGDIPQRLHASDAPTACIVFSGSNDGGSTWTTLTDTSGAPIKGDERGTKAVVPGSCDHQWPRHVRAPIPQLIRAEVHDATV